MKHGKSGMNMTKSLGKPPATVGGALRGVTEPPLGQAIAAGATLARGGGVSAKGALRSAGEKGRAVPDNCDKVAPPMDYGHY